MSIHSKITISSLALLLLLGFSACLEEGEEAAPILDPNPCEFPLDLSEYTMVWADEFETEIDPAIWSYETGDGCDRQLCGWGNNEEEWYTDEPKNSFIRDGNLVIKAIKEDTPVQGYAYTSARMVTKDKVNFQFGRIDIRAKLPRGKGLWPAIWMLGDNIDEVSWPACGEIDIMELIGDKPNEVFGTVHFGHDFWRYISSEKYSLDEGDFSTGFHTYTLLWRENCLRFMVDGNLYGTPITPSSTLPTGYPFNDEFYLLLNVAVGGNLPGSPDGTTVFPQEMEVEYVRVYEEN